MSTKENPDIVRFLKNLISKIERAEDVKEVMIDEIMDELYNNPIQNSDIIEGLLIDYLDGFGINYGEGIMKKAGVVTQTIPDDLNKSLFGFREIMYDWIDLQLQSMNIGELQGLPPYSIRVE